MLKVNNSDTRTTSLFLKQDQFPVKKGFMKIVAKLAEKQT